MLEEPCEILSKQGLVHRPRFAWRDCLFPATFGISRPDHIAGRFLQTRKARRKRPPPPPSGGNIVHPDLSPTGLGLEALEALVSIRLRFSFSTKAGTDGHRFAPNAPTIWPPLWGRRLNGAAMTPRPALLPGRLVGASCGLVRRRASLPYSGWFRIGVRPKNPRLG